MYGHQYLGTCILKGLDGVRGVLVVGGHNPAWCVSARPDKRHVQARKEPARLSEVRAVARVTPKIYLPPPSLQHERAPQGFIFVPGRAIRPVPRRLLLCCVPCWATRALKRAAVYWLLWSECTTSPAGGRRTTKSRRRAALTNTSGRVSRTSESTILREQRASHPASYSPPPPWRGKYVMSPTQTRFGAVGAGWPSSRLGAARPAGSESVVRGTNERGGWARSQRVP